MADKPWKQFERTSAELFGGKRFWSNSGEDIDFEGPCTIGQCKLVKTMSLSALTKLAKSIEKAAKEKDKLGVVCVKLREGSGNPTPTLVVLTEESWRAFFTDKEGA
jgi:hypothetical protein